jgi:hypothetical protein
MTKGTIEHDVLQILDKYPIVDILNVIFEMVPFDDIPIMKQWFYDMNRLTTDPTEPKNTPNSDTNKIIEQLREKLEREIERLDGKIGRLDRERVKEEVYRQYEPYVGTAAPGAPEKKLSGYHKPKLNYDNRIGIVRHIGVSDIQIDDNHIPLNQFGERIIDRNHPEVGDTVGFNVNSSNGTLIYLCIINKGKQAKLPKPPRYGSHDCQNVCCGQDGGGEMADMSLASQDAYEMFSDGGGETDGM